MFVPEILLDATRDGAGAGAGADGPVGLTKGEDSLRNVISESKRPH